MYSGNPESTGNDCSRCRDPTGTIQRAKITAHLCICGDDESLVKGTQKDANSQGGQQNVQLGRRL